MNLTPLLVLDNGKLDHGMDAGTGQTGATSEDDAYYAQFKVPDDMVW